LPSVQLTAGCSKSLTSLLPLSWPNAIKNMLLNKRDKNKGMAMGNI
jgi:hypothetical protein